MKKNDTFQRAPLVLAIATASVIAPNAFAQVEMDNVAGPQAQQIEEVMVQGRLKDSAEMLVSERLEEEVVTDILGSEMIGRVGDSTVAAALRRVSGLTLVNDKFVYVRGLGERYSSTTLNGATVPSPDLTRSVIPLDIFPTSVVDSLAVQKSYSADQAATFGGGNVDIRTKGIPDALTFSVELGSGMNSETDGDVLSYRGGDDDSFGTDDGTRALPTELAEALQRFKGRLGVQDIRNVLEQEGNEYGSASEAIAAAQDINRQLAKSLNRDIAIEEDSSNPDMDVKGSIGNRFYISDDWEVGFLAGGSYKSRWREEETLKRSYGFPEERTDTEQTSTYSVDLTGNLNVGIRYADEQEVSLTSLYLRNTDDDTSVRDFFNENRQVSDGRGFREYTLKYEERNMLVNQVTGSHLAGPATKALVPGGLLNWAPDELVVDWFYSDATAETDIPNEVSVSADTVTNTQGETVASSVSTGVNSSGFRFTELEDQVINYGWSTTLPLEFSTSTLELSGGFARTEKARSYKQTEFRLGSLGGDSDSLSGNLDDVFGDANIDDAENNFVFDRAGANNQSYIAATLTDAAFGKMDWTWNETWRLSAGARWEEYNQVALDWNPYGYSLDDPQITTDPEELEQATYAEDAVYPSVSLTYMGALWAETFQLRFGASKTAVRPDLREITDAIYIDPITDEQIQGNPNARPSEITNLDVRGEWYFDNGDNLTISAFYKDIVDPIEFFEFASSDTNIAREIVNAESGEITGIEIEGLKSLGFMGEVMDSFFLQGNVTVQETELVAGTEADAPTSPVREMTGASDYVVNMLVGFDSPDGMHSATLGYNVFGDRLYLAGRNGAPDAYEQPFHSLDLTYSWYPTAEITVKAKVQNLLDEAIEIERADVIVFEQKPGQSFALSAQYQF
ncbi:TonB-dependent receptor [Microbulbifer elongatus]|uniref:TonB-dependent receptor n=1 Tax=Microbulbifer elongatus TaxID=86173 RepID=A0ABT1P4R8_9GAMM|nr:TonB-dependent receptor [Microbulbifer elongatus]MCQ3831101.1 TonB-dependent receptor [Microbulbifer elongatus]